MALFSPDPTAGQSCPGPPNGEQHVPQIPRYLSCNISYMPFCNYTRCSPFFVQPVFRDDGFFMLMSQFQSPRYFLLAYLEDYKMDPAAAQPLLTFSVFDDYADDLDLTLVRCDIINKGIQDDEGLKVANSVLDSYRNDEEFDVVRAFNKTPDTFDIDGFISIQNQKWKEEKGTAV